MSSVSLRPTNWIRGDFIFFSQHGPFPAYLKMFHLSDRTPPQVPVPNAYTAPVPVDGLEITCLTAIIGVVVELARHFTMPWSVFSQCLGI
ncbi:hypothetical protein AVEN_138630-1 [Araneus ventricosus]|uniref:Uncharacterized protein n=1 Tax=Araneus ventricosus TaxID=182803 RepID=A0A4Y2TWR1_ARAVE|nr:hypothetical protein AVEN_138630-1 [Araneus ventricosus]